MLRFEFAYDTWHKLDSTCFSRVSCVDYFRVLSSALCFKNQYLSGMDSAKHPFERPGSSLIFCRFGYGLAIGLSVKCGTNFLIMTEKTPKVSMLEYCKLVLEKISFSRRLFRREYKKTFRYLGPKEHFELKRWLRSRMKSDPKPQYQLEVNTVSEISSVGRLS